MQITRRQILTAIKNEPLRAGDWFRVQDSKDNYDTPVGKSTCKVCVVGAVMRRVNRRDPSFTVWAATDFITSTVKTPTYDSELRADQKFEREYLLSNGQYLDVLSCEFEHMASSRVPYAKIRERLAKFVKNNFPKTIEVQNG